MAFKILETLAQLSALPWHLAGMLFSSLSLVQTHSAIKPFVLPKEPRFVFPFTRDHGMILQVPDLHVLSVIWKARLQRHVGAMVLYWYLVMKRAAYLFHIHSNIQK